LISLRSLRAGFPTGILREDRCAPVGAELARARRSWRRLRRALVRVARGALLVRRARADAPAPRAASARRMQRATVASVSDSNEARRRWNESHKESAMQSTR